MSDEIDWRTREPEAFERVHELLERGLPRHQIAHELKLSGMSYEDATDLIEQVHERGRPLRRKQGSAEVLGASILITLGVWFMVEARHPPHVFGVSMGPILAGAGAGALLAGLFVLTPAIEKLRS